MRLCFCTQVCRNWIEIKESFNQDLFLYLSPSSLGMRLERFDGCSAGNEVHLSFFSPSERQKWVSVIIQETLTDGEWSFIDEGRILPWPLKRWRHLHKVVFIDENSSQIIDDISFECRHAWMNLLVYPLLWISFAIRPSRYKKFFQGI